MRPETFGSWAGNGGGEVREGAMGCGGVERRNVCEVYIPRRKGEGIGSELEKHGENKRLGSVHDSGFYIQIFKGRFILTSMIRCCFYDGR